ncbi:hypothetical protein Poli38472_001955 [Pythium oligandrum]|uniref:FYVE-type domain-containing protein n=1 Tax=Pythium oligandrum TaxID=41045 RepID=A0A8K1CV38_PYTOL|nr:hypothetical protein Poli38472_001955 [Pythium oligandrum]|eukprot:TMW69799.1 hypothetical protein Poli38472_001955 [Pythium oligandrum]
MKFPQPHSPFPPLQLSPAEIDSLLQLEETLIDQTIAEFDQFAYIQNRVVDRTKWKHATTRDNLQIYSAIGDHSEDYHLIMHEQLLDSSASTSSSRTMSTSRMDVKGGMRLMGFGSLVGNINDFLFCDVTRSDDDMQIRSSYVPDGCIDWRLLLTLRGATLDNPFRMSTIKYHVKGIQGATGIGVRPRDFVMLDCAGEKTLPNGERVGYSIYHSLDIPGCEPREGMVRAQVSCSYVIRQRGSNSVEIYMRLLCEMGGNINDSIATLTIATAYAGVWMTPWGGQNKKLAWMLKQQRRNGSKKQSNPRTSDRCHVCKKSFSLLRSATRCDLCREHACSKCLIARKISYVRPVRQLVQVPTKFCKHCIMQASLIDASEIARKENVPKEVASRSEGNSDASSNDSFRKPHSDSHHSVGSDDSSPSPSSGPSDITVETVEDWEQAQANPRGTVYSYSSDDPEANQQASVNVDDYQTQLWMKMEQLRLTAEQTYQLTKDNERVMHGARLLE